MSYRKRIVILVCSIFIYLIVIVLYNRVNQNSYKEVYVLKNDLLRGETLKETDFERVSIKDSNAFLNNEIFVSDGIENYVLQNNLSKGRILLKEDLTLKSQYSKPTEESEIISIKISNPDDIVSYQIEKNSVVNLYYTGKLELAKGVLKDINLPYVSTKTENINRVDSEYITIKLLENVKVIDIFDKYGNTVESNKQVKNESNKIDTIMFEVKKDLVIKINNLKNYGQFSVSIIR